jgi:hypothetical protein
MFSTEHINNAILQNFSIYINHSGGNNKTEVMYLKKHVFFTRLLIFIISITMIFSLTSCSQQRKPIPTKQSSSKQGEQSKPPKELDKLSKAVDKIEKTLSEMHERSKKPLLIQQSEIAQQQGQGKGKQQQQQQQPQQQGAGVVAAARASSKAAVEVPEAVLEEALVVVAAASRVNSSRHKYSL